MKHVLILASALSMSVAASAAEATWTASADGYWEDNSTWKDSTPPADMDGVYIYPADLSGNTVTNCLKLRNDVSFKLGYLHIRSDKTRNWALDCNGHRFTVPNLDVGTSPAYDTYPMLITPYATGVDQNKSAFVINGGGSTVDPASSWMDIDDGYVVMHDDASVSGRLSLSLLRGHFNFYNPGGADRITGREFWAFKSVSTTPTHKYALDISGADTQVFLPFLLLHDSGATNTFSLSEGARLWANGIATRYSYGAFSSYSVTGGATLESANSIDLGTYPGQHNKYSFHPHAVTFSNSTVSCVNTLNTYGPMDIDIYGSSVSALNIMWLCGSDTSTQTLHIADSTFYATNFYFSIQNPAKPNVRLSSKVERTTFNSMRQGASLGRGEYMFDRVTFTAPNSSYAISLGNEAHLTMSCCTSLSYQVKIGLYTDTAPLTQPSRLVVTNGVSSFLKVLLGQNQAAEMVLASNGTFVVRGEKSNSASDTKSVELCARTSNTSTAEQDSTVTLERGGTLVCGRIFGGPGATVNGGKAKATVIGDGGTIQYCGGAELSASYKFISGLDALKATRNGLFVDSNGYDLPMRQPASDATGSAGIFVKTGIGTLTLEDVGYSVSTTRVEKGTLALAGTTSGFATSLEVAGGTFSLANGAADDVTVAGLFVSGGTIRVDPADRITVDGPVSFSDLKVEFPTLPATDVQTTVLVMRGPRDTAAEASWLNAFSDAIGDTTYFKFEAAYDDVAGETAFRAVRKAEASPAGESANVSWTGSGAWASQGNWDGNAAPTASSRAVFASESAGSPVAVAAGDTAEAIRFSADKGYTLAGTGPLALAGERGANAIEALAGENEISAPVSTAARIDATVESGASLTLSGAISGGGLNKTGGGKLVVSGANSFSENSSIAGGLTRIISPGTLHSVGGSLWNIVSLGTGTLELDAAASAAFDSTIAFAETGTPTAPVIIMNHGDMEADVSAAGGGAPIKRGAGRLVLNLPERDTSFPGNDGGKTSNTAYTQLIEFPEDGSGPTTANTWWGLNVAEGELVLRKPDSATATLPSTMVGMAVTNCAATPTLTLDGGKWSSSGIVEVGVNAGYNHGQGGKYPTKSLLVLTNGAAVSLSTLKVGNGSWNNNSGGCPEVRVMGGSTLTTTSGANLMPRPDGGAKAVMFVKDSSFVYDGLSMAVVDMSFDNATARFRREASAYFNFTEFGGGKIAFRNGSTLFCRGIKGLAVANDVEIVFDGARMSMFNAAGSDPTDFSVTSADVAVDHFSFVMQNDGMSLDVPDGYTFTSQVPFTGDGGMTKTGAGALKLVGDAYRLKGTLDLSGPLDLTENTATVAAAKMRGTGTVHGGAFRALGIVREVGQDLAPVSDDILTFNDADLSGGVVVELSATELPTASQVAEPIPVLTCAGTTTPNFSNWRVRWTDGSRLMGTFVEVNRTVYLTGAFKPGIQIIVR